MFRIDTGHLCKETRTGLSAFFCLPGTAILTRVAVASLLTLLLAAQAPALQEKKPRLQLKGFSIKAVDWSNRTAEAELLIAIDNPGPAFKVKDLNYRLKLNEKQAAEGKYDKPIEVPADSRATFDLPCSVDLSALPGVAWAVITGGFDVHYELETEFTVPLFASLSPRVKSSIVGDLSLAQTVNGWTARIKERFASK
jgi:LEA14-like dessication related protein